MPVFTSSVLGITAKVAVTAALVAGGVVGFKYARPSGDAPPAPTPAVAQRAAEAGRYVYQTFGADADELFVGSTDGAAATRITRVPHAAEWAIRSSASPDGSRVAYTVMPGGAARPETDAEAWIVGIDGAGAKRVASGVDLLARPVWNADSTEIVVRRYPKLGDGLLPQRLELARQSGLTTPLVVRDATVGLYAIGFAGGRFFFAELTPDGTAVRSTAGGAERFEFSVEGVARDWTLSGDGKRLAFLAPVSRGDVTYRAFSVDLQANQKRIVEAQTAAGDQLGPVFRPNSTDLTVGGPAAGASPQGISTTGAVVGPVGAAAAKGFDQPLGWSADGGFLAVRHFDGRKADDPGAAADQVVLPSGQRRALSGTFVGWVE